MAEVSESVSGEGEGRSATWQRVAAFLCFGMALGAPATQSLAALKFLPGGSVVTYVLAVPMLYVGSAVLARLVLAPFVDAFDPPLFKRLGRRRGWTALLTGLLLAICIPILLMSPVAGPTVVPARQIDIVLIVAAIAVAGALLATVDALRSVQPGTRNRGMLAAAQYLGIIVPAAIALVFLGNLTTFQANVFLVAFIAAAWLGLWLLPGREAPSARLFERPELQRFLGGEHNLSRGGTAVTAWLYGVFVCPIADFFRRFGGLAWAILAVLVLGDLATNIDTRQILQLNAGQLNAGHIQTIGTIRSVAQFVGAIIAAWLVWRMGPARGLAVAFVFAAAAVLSGLAAIAAAPSVPWFMIALAIGAVAQGAILIGFVAFVAQATTPSYAAWQFSLLWMVGLPNNVINALHDTGNAALGVSGTFILFLVLLAAVFSLTWWLARRLDAAELDD